MNLRSNIITTTDVLEAVNMARNIHGQDIFLDDYSSTTGRRHAHSITFYLESWHGRRATNRRGTGTSGRAASWTAWGWVIAELFRRDPEAIIGQYKGVEQFRAWCQEEHDRWTQYRPSQKYERDISFLKLVEVDYAS